MSGQMKINFRSWQVASGAFSDAATGASTTLSQVVSSTTNPAACGAAGGLATVDGAVSIMLSVFGEVMQNSVVTSLQTGLSGEAEALTSTGKALESMEDANTAEATTIEGAW
ncbi:hypothetical protein ACQB6R_01520 [Propionibacteriaceae bacterium G1746]|uniref:hypothetical protein n=1 Tax=Aestuariimicrobium sp. G57 TaxID=3418485 RepID=UPI003C1F9866